MLITIFQRPNSNQSLSKSHTNQQIRTQINTFIWSLLNTCMMNKYTCPKDKPANEWLAENGLCAKQLLNTELAIQQAQRIAYNLITHHHQLLSTQQITQLNQYIKAASYYNSRMRIRPQTTHKVMNIGSCINRKLFKQNRKLKNQSN